MDATRIARQPILDQRGLVGFELLFRGGPADDDDMTTRTMTAALLEIGLDSVIGPARGWLNCTTSFLLGRHYEVLPKDRVVLEVLEHQAVTDDLIDALVMARETGYRVALDDYVQGSDHQRLLAHADVVKVDLQHEAAMDVIAELAGEGKQVLAEKVETVAEQEQAAAAGATLFQGYYFAKPETIERRRLTPGAAGALSLMGLLGRADATLDDFGDALGSDAALAARVLLLANSSWVGIARRIESVREAIVYLGLERIRRLVLLTIFSGLQSSPQTEVIRLAASRADLCERLAHRAELAGPAAHTAGLLTVLPAMLGHAVHDEDLQALGLSPVVVEGIADGTGPFGELVADVDAILGIVDRDIPAGIDLDTVEVMEHADALTGLLT